MPHAAAFPSTSSSRSPSQAASWPRAPRRARGARSGRSPGRPARGRSARASPRAAAASRGSARRRCPRPSARRSRAAARRRRRAGTSRGRGSASRPSGRAGRRHRSPASVRGGGGAARSRDPGRASGGQPLPALRPAPLQDRPARARGHARAEAVLALPAANVGLVGPLHEAPEARKRRPWGRGAASIDKGFSQRVLHRPAVDNLRGQRASRRGVFGPAGHPFETLCPHLWRAVWNSGKSLQNRGFSPTGSPPEGAIVGRQTRCYARPSLSSRRSRAPRVEQPIELTAETLWTEVSGRLKGALNDSTYRTWFGEVEGQRSPTRCSSSRFRTTSRASGSRAISSS